MFDQWKEHRASKAFRRGFCYAMEAMLLDGVTPEELRDELLIDGYRKSYSGGIHRALALHQVAKEYKCQIAMMRAAYGEPLSAIIRAEQGVPFVPTRRCNPKPSEAPSVTVAGDPEERRKRQERRKLAEERDELRLALTKIDNVTVQGVHVQSRDKKYNHIRYRAYKDKHGRYSVVAHPKNGKAYSLAKEWKMSTILDQFKLED